MASGVILMATGPAGTLTSPTSFYEYDPVANGYTQLNGPTGTLTLNTVPYVCNMLALPDGNILFTSDSTQLYVYTPSGAPLAVGQPTITTISDNGDGSFTLTGTLLNGICEGAAYGDDAQMATNYPIVRMTAMLRTMSIMLARQLEQSRGDDWLDAGDYPIHAAAESARGHLLVVVSRTATLRLPFR